MFVTDVNLPSMVEIIHRCPSGTLKPNQFFFSADGVPLLVYEGFSAGMLDLQQALSAVPGIIPVGRFAQFPKTTLGALNGDRLRLSRENLGTLRAITDKYNQEIRQAGLGIPVRQLSIVIFETRSLEHRVKTYSVSLDSDQSDTVVPEDNRHYVQEQLIAFAPEKLDEFFARLTTSGYRKTHYRELHLESTLVFDLPLPHPAYINAFVAEIDRELPGYFCWFGQHSRHVTVRALFREEN